MAAVLPSGLAVVRVLHANSDDKSIAVLARTPSGDTAIVALARTPLTEEEARAIVEGRDTLLLETNRNDRYARFTGVPPAPLGRIDVFQVCPATEADVVKYSSQQRAMVRETPELYARVTRPWVASLDPAETAWIRNVLEANPAPSSPSPSPSPSSGGSPAVTERAELAAEDYVLLHDTKWDGATVSSLYMIAVARGPLLAVPSLRELRAEHVGALRRLRAECVAHIGRRYGLGEGALRVFLHYAPSFWHLHVHFAALGCPAMGDNVVAGRCHLLDDVLDNIERDPLHYARASLSLVLRTSDPLYQRLLAQQQQQQQQ
eukprot:m51a1_g8518 hypothetical protein (318) ;mRNA; f:102631-103890